VESATAVSILLAILGDVLLEITFSLLVYRIEFAYIQYIQLNVFQFKGIAAAIGGACQCARTFV
jgi:hypothetical protein